MALIHDRICSRTSHAAFIVALLAVAPATPAGTFTLGVPSAADNTLYESPTGALSNGAGSAMFAGRNSQTNNSRRRGVVRFDLDGLVPEGATITSATLRLYQDAANNDPRTVTLHRVLQAWGEGTSVAGGSSGGGGGATSTAGDATWIHTSFPGVLWSTPGGSFETDAAASTSVAGVGFWEWSSPALLDEVRSFIANPGLNFGWLLRGDESTAGTSKRFLTREADADFRPQLVLTYIPSPGAAWALSLAAVGGLRRRSR